MDKKILNHQAAMLIGEDGIKSGKYDDILYTRPKHDIGFRITKSIYGLIASECDNFRAKTNHHVTPNDVIYWLFHSAEKNEEENNDKEKNDPVIVFLKDICNNLKKYIIEIE